MKSESGVIMLLALFFSAILLTLITALVSYWMSQIGHHQQAIGRAKALSIAEAGAEMAIWKMNNIAGYAGEVSTAYGEGMYNISVVNQSSTTKLVKVDAFVPNSTSPRAKRTVQVVAVIGTTNVGFSYGVQVGNGGLEMSNSATIKGNVYANDDIIGANTSRIQGTAIVAGDGIIRGMEVDLNAQAHSVQDSDIGGMATATTITNSTIGGNAIADSISNCTVLGNATYDVRVACAVSGSSTTPNPNVYSPAPAIDLPVTDEQIDEWEIDAEDGGVIGTQNFNSGTRSLGPVKINGDLILTNTAELVVTGTIWVTGDITIMNQAILKLSPAYGGLSGVVMAGSDGNAVDGFIDIANNTQILGSGSAGSYLMLLSQRTGVAAPAIRNNQTGAAAILYAGDGMIEIAQSGNMKEVTAMKLKIAQNAVITYEVGLASTLFTSGPGGGWEISDGTWQLLD